MKYKTIITAMLMFLLLSNHLVAQKSIIFTYNPNNKILTIETATTTWGFSMADTIGNKTLTALGEGKTTNGDDFMLKTDSNNYSSKSFNKVVCDYFDSIEISKVVFYETNDANCLKKCAPLKSECIVKPLNTPPPLSESNNDCSKTIIIVIVIISLFGCGFFILSRRKKKVEKPALPATEEKKPVPGLKMVRPETQNRTVGLEHVREHNEEYYLLDMQEQFEDTAIHNIYLHHTVIKKTFDFFKTFLESANKTPETGCFFIGCWEYVDESHKTYNISVEDIVEPGDDIEPDEYSFNFGYKIGGYLDMKVRNMREKTGRDYVHTVWMHSHPGLGLFLSSQDLVVQDLLKNKKEPGRLTAFVIDTNTANWELAVFTSKMNGEMNNKSDMKHTYSLDEFYEWSRKAKKQFSNEERDWDNYLKIELNGKGGNGFSALYMSGKAINQMEEATYVTSNANNVKFLSGNADTPGNWCCIEECNQKNESIIGILIIDSESSYETIFTKYEDSIRDSLIIMVYRSDEEIWISSRKDLNEQYNGSEKMTQYTMGQMREWMRRKRIP